MATSSTKEKVEQLSGSNLLIILVLISLLVVGVTGLAAKALVTSIIRDTKVVSAKQKADQQLKTDLDAAPKLVTAYKALGPQAAEITDAMPSTADFPSLIVVLENMSNSAGVRLKTVSPAIADTATTGSSSPAAAGSAPKPQPYAFSLTFDGTYDSVKALLSAMELSARPMKVTAIQLTGSGSSLSGEIDAQTYYQDKATLPFTEETIK